jgi:anti-sigma B factor antagonist
VTGTHRPEPFAADVARRGPVAIVTVTGELDIATSPELVAALAGLDPGYDKLVVDLSGCSFFASSGISILLDENDRAARDGFELVIVKAPQEIQRMFDLAGLDDRLRFEEPPA